MYCTSVVHSSVRHLYMAFIWLFIVIQTYLWYFTSLSGIKKAFFCIQQVHIKLSRSIWYFKEMYSIYQVCLVFHSWLWFFTAGTGCLKIKSRILETLNLSTDANSSTAARKLLSIFFREDMFITICQFI